MVVLNLVNMLLTFLIKMIVMLLYLFQNHLKLILHAIVKLDILMQHQTFVPKKIFVNQIFLLYQLLIPYQFIILIIRIQTNHQLGLSPRRLLASTSMISHWLKILKQVAKTMILCLLKKAN